MIITIEGKPGEGKSTLAKKICHGKKTYNITEFDLSGPFWTINMDYDTEIIVVEDVKKYNETYLKFCSQSLKIEKIFQKTVEIEMPDVVLVLQNRIRKHLKYRNACNCCGGE